MPKYWEKIEVTMKSNMFSSAIKYSQNEKQYVNELKKRIYNTETV